MCDVQAPHGMPGMQPSTVAAAATATTATIAIPSAPAGNGSRRPPCSLHTALAVAATKAAAFTEAAAAASVTSTAANRAHRGCCFDGRRRRRVNACLGGCIFRAESLDSDAMGTPEMTLAVALLVFMLAMGIVTGGERSARGSAVADAGRRQHASERRRQRVRSAARQSRRSNHRRSGRMPLRACHNGRGGRGGGA